ncbi:MAG: tetratricopeptide repeat protein [Alphaproteobacteria bacterium]|nr:tetratricopeptide repeat protein [Alphaproteobacteria bacterium]MDE1969927.1 tetratricopeptide repeat protein [Alphaproteobacteria bacterium]
MSRRRRHDARAHRCCAVARHRVAAYNKRGTAYYHNSDYPQALADYSAAIKLSPQ